MWPPPDYDILSSPTEYQIRGFPACQCHSILWLYHLSNTTKGFPKCLCLRSTKWQSTISTDYTQGKTISQFNWLSHNNREIKFHWNFTILCITSGIAEIYSFSPWFSGDKLSSHDWKTLGWQDPLVSTGSQTPAGIVYRNMTITYTYTNGPSFKN
jgi:hypothetical protein